MDDKMKIMIVEDDKALAEEIGAFLIRWGYETEITDDFENIVGTFRNVRPELVLMDVNLPYFDGFYWCSQIRKISQVPIVFISSRDDDKDKIMAMAQGGDDYVEKPFCLELLKAKIEAILRRAYEYKVRNKLYISESLSFDAAIGALYHNGVEVDLTKSERRIITKLMENRSRIVTREELMMTLWSTDEYVSDGTLTTMISRLRSKLKEECGEEIIFTKKGQGYQIL